MTAKREIECMVKRDPTARNALAELVKRQADTAVVAANITGVSTQLELLEALSGWDASAVKQVLEAMLDGSLLGGAQ